MNEVKSPWRRFCNVTASLAGNWPGKACFFHTSLFLLRLFDTIPAKSTELKRRVLFLKGIDMQWNRMLWWMGAVLLLACLLLSNRTISQDITASRKMAEGKTPLVVGKEILCPVPGVPDATALAPLIEKDEAGDICAKNGVWHHVCA
jgi:hypothetical protein